MAEEAEDLPKIFNRSYPGGNNTPIRLNTQSVLGFNNMICDSAEGVIISGSENVVGCNAQNVTLLNSSGCIVAGGLRNVTIINSSGITVTEDNTIVQNNTIILSPSSGVVGYFPYKKYVALLSQSGTDVPTAIVLENTFNGTVVWTRTVAGTYRATLAGAFPSEDKTWFVLINNTATNTIFIASWLDADTMAVETISPITGTTHVDDKLYKSPFEIRVYN